MYDRAPRNFTFQLSVGTSFDIGPGTYQHGSTLKLKNDAYAPFQSLASRDFNLANEDSVNLPGPSQYDSKLIRNKILGGSSISNTDVRFRPFKSDIPGPGQYCIEDKIQCYTAENKKKKVADKTKISYKRVPIAPSIPDAKTAFGYEEGPYGTLVRQEPPLKDNSLGPAFYDPKFEDTLTTKKYKGCFWSYDRAKRSDLCGSKGPGPGEYEPFSDKWSDLVDYYQNHDEKMLHPRIPRFFEELQKKAIKENIPGPDVYLHSGKVECIKPIYNEYGVKIEHPPFGTLAKRFPSSINNMPGPGTYNDPRTALNSLKKVTGMKGSPFGITATRFTESHADLDIPGPQVYTLPDELSNVKPSYISFTKKGGFGSTNVRNLDFKTKDSYDIPGPSYYQPKSAIEASKVHQQMSSMFASLTSRDYDPVTIGKAEMPDSTQYDVITSFKRSQGKKVYSEPRTKEAKRRHCSFMTNASRYSKGSPLDCADPSLPGPSSYELRSLLNTKTGKFYYREKRFHEHFDDTPGPGQYDLPEKISNTVIKSTFNHTLGQTVKEPVAVKFHNITTCLPPSPNPVAVL